LTAVLAQWHGVLRQPDLPLDQRHMGHWQGRIVQVMRRHGVRSRRNQLLVWRALSTLDATVLRLPVRFDVLQATADFYRRHRPPLAVLAWRAVADRWRRGDLDGTDDLWRAAGRLVAGPGSTDRPLRVRRQDEASSPHRSGVAQVASVLVGVALAVLAAGPSGPAATRPAALVGCALCLTAGLWARGR
jgi:hypothetical protein